MGAALHGRRRRNHGGSRALARLPRSPRQRRLVRRPPEGALMDGAGPAPIVEARSLEKMYETGAVSVHALKGVDLAIRPGEIVSIMGPSGCGKTTLLNCLSGLDSIDGGDVLI